MESTEKSPSAATIILLFGLIAGLGDVVYEGGRSIIPSYLSSLGYTAFVVGLLLGGSELIGYLTRILVGHISDRRKWYWGFIISGYSLLIVVPFLGLSSATVLLVLFIILERVAKGLRGPSKDTVFSALTQDVGVGKAFGLHEFFDQLGAVLGPAMVAFVLYRDGTFKSAFLIMIIPYLILVLFLVLLYRTTAPLSRQKMAQLERNGPEDEQLPPQYWFYSASVLFNIIGLFPVTLILYVSSSVFSFYEVALLYLVIQGVDAISAIIFGYLYDRIGGRLIQLVLVISVLPAIFISSNLDGNITLAAIAFGVVLGAQESIMRARISEITIISKRGLGYGFFQALFGLGLFLSGALYGLFLDLEVDSYLVVGFSILFQITALVLYSHSLPSPEDGIADSA